MKLAHAALAVGLVMAFAGISAAQTIQMKCRPLPDQNAYLGPNETYVNGLACHAVASAKADVEAAPATKADPPATIDPVDPNVKRDAHLAWIDPTNPFASYVVAAAQKKHVPVEFTTKKAYAGLFVTVSPEGSRDGSAWRAIFTGDSGQTSALSMTVSDAATGAVAFSYACHKGGFSFAATGHEDFQSAAECLAKHWADHADHVRRATAARVNAEPAQLARR